MCDWEAVQSEYITTDQSLEELGRKHGIPRSTIQLRSGKEGWVAKRKAFKKKAVETAVECAVADEADRLGKIINAAQSMAGVIEDVFKDAKQFHRHLVTDTYIGDDGSKEILTVEKQFEKVDSRAVKDLTGALKDMTLVLRNLHNLPTQAEAEAQRIAAERLNMDKEKMKAADGVDKTIHVVMSNGWEDLAK